MNENINIEIDHKVIIRDNWGEYVDFRTYQLGDIIKNGGPISSIRIPYKLIEKIEYKDNWVYINTRYSEEDCETDNIYKIRYVPFRNYFITHRIIPDPIEIRLKSMEDKLDRLSAHVLNLMVGLGHLPYDHNGEFP